MKITNKKEILDQYRFKNFNVGDYLIMLTHELCDGVILVKAGKNKAINIDTGEVYLLDPDQLFIKVDKAELNKKEENEDVPTFDWGYIVNKSKKIEEEGLKEIKEQLEEQLKEGFNLDHCEYGPIYIEEVCKDDKIS